MGQACAQITRFGGSQLESSARPGHLWQYAMYAAVAYIRAAALGQGRVPRVEVSAVIDLDQFDTDSGGGPYQRGIGEHGDHDLIDIGH